MSKTDFTKEAIGATFKTMVRENTFHKVTVTALCKATGISRSCFYTHFKDTYDVAIWLFDHEFLSGYDIPPGTYFFDDLFLAFCEHCYEDPLYYSKIIAMTGQNSFRQYFSASVKPIVMSEAKKGIHDDDLAEVFIDTISSLIMRAIPRWLKDAPQTPPRVFVRQILAICANAAYNFGDHISHSVHLQPKDALDNRD